MELSNCKLLNYALTIIIFLIVYTFFNRRLYQHNSNLQYYSQSPQNKSTAAEFDRDNQPLIFSWENRILYIKRSYDPFTRKITQDDLISTNIDGGASKIHPLVCEGRKIKTNELIGDIARSTNGNIIAFLVPIGNGKSQSKDSGTIHIFDLDTNTCFNLAVSATGGHIFYKFGLTFSPDGKYLAYNFYGLNVYNFETEQAKDLTRHEGSAFFIEIVSGPLVWSSDSSSIYMSVSIPFEEDDMMPTYLAKVNVEHAVDLESIEPDCDVYKEGDVCRKNPIKVQSMKNEQKILDLPAFVHRATYLTHTVNGLPDNPTIYALSPDEQRLAIEESGNLIILDLNESNTEPLVLWSRQLFEDGRIQKVIWLANGWLIWSTDNAGVGSSLGDIWGSYNLQPPVKLTHGEVFSVNFSGNLMAYNFEYYGDYYIPPNNPRPSGFVSSGHRYDGLAIFNLETRKEKILSGNDLPSGELQAWFYK